MNDEATGESWSVRGRERREEGKKERKRNDRPHHGGNGRIKYLPFSTSDIWNGNL